MPDYGITQRFYQATGRTVENINLIAGEIIMHFLIASRQVGENTADTQIPQTADFMAQPRDLGFGKSQSVHA
jgi:hypothetical protein